MRVVRARDYEDMSRRAAHVIGALVTLRPDAVLGLATGSTPEGTYARLAERCVAGDLDLSGVTTFNLDEYLGLPPEDPQSFRWFMDRHLFGPVGLAPERTHVPDGCGDDMDAVCRAYDAALEAAGYPDLQLLGIGGNGHVGFNEPADAFPTGTHVVALAGETIRDNSRFFDSPDQVPTHAVTVGMDAIMRSRRVLVLASGRAKAEAVRALCLGPVTPTCPASVLRLHADCTLVADEDALSLCPELG